MAGCCQHPRVQISHARPAIIYQAAAPGRIRLDYSESIGWKFERSIGYSVRHCIVPREWGRLVCSTEACKHGSSESVGPVPLAQSRNSPAVMNAHCDTTGNFVVLAALNTAAERKFRGNYDIFLRSTAAQSMSHTGNSLAITFCSSDRHRYHDAIVR